MSLLIKGKIANYKRAIKNLMDAQDAINSDDGGDFIHGVVCTISALIGDLETEIEELEEGA
jgi:hypothetical protein